MERTTLELELDIRKTKLHFWDEVRRTYNIVGKKYHELFHDEMSKKDYDCELLNQFATCFTSKSLICDVGCGPSGHIGRYLFDKGLDVLGLDISEECINIARKVNPGMRFEVGNMADMNIVDDSLDGIISFYSIIHTPKRYQSSIFREFNRTLKKGGKLLIVVKQGDSEAEIEELLGFETKIWFAHFSEDEIRDYLSNNGFSIRFLETRKPYDFEISNSRIYAIGEKKD
ncbi:MULTISPECIES: class I SAM-dependent methyltransferase [Pelosinus]|uniref:Methyltransferase type 11 n=1 Tax=Pelosinus fermentans B4 TaxID=1149862 RepID=I8RGL0_9FIRM|nr:MULTISPECIES: class I SAM-dependent methyltransferase [Pelosinus]MDF2596946.1 methylase involved in ubiquinone/menaquinone biosynthesis [Clostridia bacterium]EIW18788.1 Methyltransferase type 11 [Pelosinus fermentans B4]EIW22002.1 Methyltransferase type 11 [Pelosinus fermentans A11]OAM95146.1 Methyltransferase type 11 [Pelosinus fermentans DSM 17108]SDR23942.1 Methyltransferase domain-containing protein [Pelosinus fermentans]